MDISFSIKTGDLEARSCNTDLSNDRPHTTAEIVKWQGEEPRRHCYALAYWKQAKEGYNLRFVGSRPFDVEESIFMRLANISQSILDEKFASED